MSQSQDMHFILAIQQENNEILAYALSDVTQIYDLLKQDDVVAAFENNRPYSLFQNPSKELIFDEYVQQDQLKVFIEDGAIICTYKNVQLPHYICFNPFKGAQFPVPLVLNVCVTYDVEINSRDEDEDEDEDGDLEDINFGDHINIAVNIPVIGSPEEIKLINFLCEVYDLEDIIDNDYVLDSSFAISVGNGAEEFAIEEAASQFDIDDIDDYDTRARLYSFTDFDIRNPKDELLTIQSPNNLLTQVNGCSIIRASDILELIYKSATTMGSACTDNLEMQDFIMIEKVCPWVNS